MQPHPAQAAKTPCRTPETLTLNLNPRPQNLAGPRSRPPTPRSTHPHTKLGWHSGRGRSWKAHCKHDHAASSLLPSCAALPRAPTGPTPPSQGWPQRGWNARVQAVPVAQLPLGTAPPGQHPLSPAVMAAGSHGQGMTPPAGHICQLLHRQGLHLGRDAGVLPGPDAQLPKLHTFIGTLSNFINLCCSPSARAQGSGVGDGAQHWWVLGSGFRAGGWSSRFRGQGAALLATAPGSGAAGRFAAAFINLTQGMPAWWLHLCGPPRSLRQGSAAATRCSCSSACPTAGLAGGPTRFQPQPYSWPALVVAMVCRQPPAIWWMGSPRSASIALGTTWSLHMWQRFRAQGLGAPGTTPPAGGAGVEACCTRSRRPAVCPRPGGRPVPHLAGGLERLQRLLQRRSRCPRPAQPGSARSSAPRKLSRQLGLAASASGAPTWTQTSQNPHASK